MMTLLQQHRLWNIVKETKYNPEPTSIVSSSTPTQNAIDSWQANDGRAHAFMLFKLNLQVARKCLGKDVETAKNVGYSPAKVLQS